MNSLRTRTSPSLSSGTGRSVFQWSWSTPPVSSMRMPDMDLGMGGMVDVVVGGVVLGSFGGVDQGYSAGLWRMRMDVGERSLKNRSGTGDVFTKIQREREDGSVEERSCCRCRCRSSSVLCWTPHPPHGHPGTPQITSAWLQMSDKGKNKYPSGVGMGWMMSWELVSTRINQQEAAMFRRGEP